MAHRRRQQPTRRLFELRVNSGLSVRTLAQLTGLHYEQLYRYESGAQVPRVTNQATLAKFFGVRPTEIWPVDGDDRPVVEHVVEHVVDEAPAERWRDAVAAEQLLRETKRAQRAAYRKQVRERAARAKARAKARERAKVEAERMRASSAALRSAPDYGGGAWARQLIGLGVQRCPVPRRAERMPL